MRSNICRKRVEDDVHGLYIHVSPPIDDENKANNRSSGNITRCAKEDTALEEMPMEYFHFNEITFNDFARSRSVFLTVLVVCVCVKQIPFTETK